MMCINKLMQVDVNLNQIDPDEAISSINLIVSCRFSINLLRVEGSGHLGFELHLKHFFYLAFSIPPTFRSSCHVYATNNNTHLKG